MMQEASNISSPGKHVAVLAFPCYSHGMPLFDLTRKLAEAAPQVCFSYFNSARQISSIFSTQTDLLSNLKAYSVEDGVPEGYDGTKLPHRELHFFASLMPGNVELGINVSVRETGRKITCIITDSFLSFPVRRLSEEMQVPWIAFCVDAPYFFSLELHADEIKRLYVNSPNKQRPEDQSLDVIPGLSSMSMGDIPVPFSPLKEWPPELSLFSLMIKMRLVLPQASAVVFSSYEELNPTIINEDLRSKLRSVLYVGCLTTPPFFSATSRVDAAGCLSWLDEQKEASVIYVSFGSVAPLPRGEIAELAEAIEVCGLPFLWSLRDGLKECLPDGFLERTSKHGKVVPWAPQNQVLAHPSTGVHVTHCGYNAVGESIFAGMPMICRPIWADNHMNCRMVEEVWGIGVRVKGGVLTKSGVIESLETIFHREKGKKIREAINKLREVALKAAGSDGSVLKDLRTLEQIASQEQ